MTETTMDATMTGTLPVELDPNAIGDDFDGETEADEPVDDPVDDPSKAE